MPIQTQFPATFFKRKFSYYVDSVNGSNANSGRVANAAFQTLSALPTLQSGQSVGLACGSSWNEQLTITANNVSVASYGSGAKPIIDASDIITSWQTSTDRADANTNVYSKSVAFTSYDSSTWANAFEDGVFLLKATSLANCQATAGTYWIAASNPTTTQTIYIHPTGSTNPNSNGRVYRVPVRAHGIDARNMSQIIVENIRCQRALHQGGAVKVGENSTVRRCDLLYCNSHNVFASQGSVIDSCLIKYHYYGVSSNSFIVFNQNIPTGSALEVRNCTIGEDVHDSTSVGIYCHNNTSGSFGALTLKNCTWQHVGIAVTSFNTTAVTIQNNTFTECDQAGRADFTGSTYSYTDCAFTNTLSAGNVRWFSPNAASTTCQLTRCSYVSKRTSNAALYTSQSNTTFTLNDCSFDVNTNQTAPQGIWFNTTTGNVLTMNNTDWIGDFWQSQIIINGAAASYTGDNNTFSGQFNFACQYRGVSYNNIANWRTATGQDANSSLT